MLQLTAIAMLKKIRCARMSGFLIERAEFRTEVLRLEINALGKVQQQRKGCRSVPTSAKG
jgi:hypothetical protein